MFNWWFQVGVCVGLIHLGVEDTVGPSVCGGRDCGLGSRVHGQNQGQI